jgi:hypothetical protein
MRIAICSSMTFSEQLIEMKNRLERRGHVVFISRFAEKFLGKSESEKEELNLFHQRECDVIRHFWEKINDSDAILVLNYEKRGIPGYIGGNTLMEIGFAHVLRKKIYFVNPIPDIVFYRSELEAVRPSIVGEDLTGL